MSENCRTLYRAQWNPPLYITSPMSPSGCWIRGAAYSNCMWKGRKSDEVEVMATDEKRKKKKSTLWEIRDELIEWQEHGRMKRNNSEKLACWMKEMKEESKSSRQMIYDIQRPLSDANGIETCPSFSFSASLLVSSRMFSTAQSRLENDWASITHYVPLGHHLGLVRLLSVKHFW